MADNCTSFAKREIERLNREIEHHQESIRRHIETRDAWDTILRNAGNEPQAAQASTSESASQPAKAQANEEQPALDEDQPEAEAESASEEGQKVEAAAKANTVPELLMDACKRSINPDHLLKRLSSVGSKKEKFRGLGLG